MRKDAKLGVLERETWEGILSHLVNFLLSYPIPGTLSIFEMILRSTSGELGVIGIL